MFFYVLFFLTSNIAFENTNNSPFFYMHQGRRIRDIQLVFETVWVLAASAQANHIVSLCSGPSLVFHLCTFSMRLSIKDETLYVVNIVDAICEYVNM